jgi:hypothetical protein
MNGIKDESWTEFLYLERFLLLFVSLSPEPWGEAKAQMAMLMVIDPADYLTKVHCLVLAIFGSADTSLPVEKSVALNTQYLTTAGNEAVTIEVFPHADHSIHIGEEYAPGYFDLMLTWLSSLLAKRGW